jgi:hypothetical protein
MHALPAACCTLVFLQPFIQRSRVARRLRSVAGFACMHTRILDHTHGMVAGETAGMNDRTRTVAMA